MIYTDLCTVILEAGFIPFQFGGKVAFNTSNTVMETIAMLIRGAMSIDLGEREPYVCDQLLTLMEMNTVKIDILGQSRIVFFTSVEWE